MVTRHQTIRTHHVIGAGALASCLGIYQFASDNGLLGLVGYKKNPASNFANPFPGTDSNGDFNKNNQVGTSNGWTDPSRNVPGGIPTSYAANDYSRPATQPTQVAYGNAYSANNYQNQPQTSSGGDIRVFFSPQGGCTEAIVNEINQSQRQVLIQAYSFTSEPIAAACVAAHNRGVAVYAVLDKSQESEQYSAADFLANNGIPTVIDSKHQIAHNKVILIDGRTLITGSFNFTTNAEKSNAENLLIIHNRPDLYSAYETNMLHHFEHSLPYAGRGSGQSQHNNSASTHNRR